MLGRQVDETAAPGLALEARLCSPLGWGSGQPPAQAWHRGGVAGDARPPRLGRGALDLPVGRRGLAGVVLHRLSLLLRLVPAKRQRARATSGCA